MTVEQNGTEQKKNVQRTRHRHKELSIKSLGKKSHRICFKLNSTRNETRKRIDKRNHSMHIQSERMKWFQNKKKKKQDE